MGGWLACVVGVVVGGGGWGVWVPQWVGGPTVG